MIRVCVSILFLITGLAACATDKPEAATASAQHLDTPAQGENILACTGLPVAGQKCGLALPKL
jgi:hypothetical protein